jgi:DNA-binding transcriptional ArsR family regulator
VVKSSELDSTFRALSDPTRREILEQLSLGPATISELARPLEISLPGLMKHVRVLERAALVTTVKRGRMRQCRLGPEQLEDASAWIEGYRGQWERRLDRLATVVRNKEGGT